MTQGIGIDIIEVSRIASAMNKHSNRFINRIFTLLEQNYCFKKKEPALHFAGRFAAKEAVVKAFGTGFTQGLSWLDFEVQNDVSGKPVIKLSPHANKLLGSPIIQLSISHCKEYATAVALIT